MRYAAGYNMFGHLPDEGALVEDVEWHDALLYLIDTIEIWWSEDYEICETDEDRLMVDGRYLEIDTLLNSCTPNEEFDAKVIDGNDNIWSFWIVAEPEF